MTIRRATLDDIPAIKEMAAVVFRDTYKNIVSQEQLTFMMDLMYSELSLEHQITTDNNIFYICEGRGFVSFRYKERLDDGVELFQLEKLYVMPGDQGTGLGRQLFETVVKIARESSVVGTRIELDLDKNARAVSFFEHMGMNIVRQGIFPIGKGYYMNDYIMSIDC